MDLGPVLTIVQAAWPPAVAGLIVWPLTWISRLGRADRAHAPIKRDRTEPYWVSTVFFASVAFIMLAFRTGIALAPVSAGDWVPYIVLVAFALGLIAATARTRGTGKWVIRFAGVMLVGFFGSIARVRHLWHSTAAPVANPWGFLEAIWWFWLFAAVTCAGWWCVERVTDRTRGVSGPGVLAIWLFGAIQIVVMGLSNLSASLVLVSLAAAAGAAVPIALWRPRLTLAFGGSTVPVVVCAGVVFQAMLWAQAEGDDAVTGGAKTGYTLLLLLAAALPLAADIGPLARMSDGRRTMAKLLLAILGAGLCSGMAFMLRPPPLE